MSFYLKTPNEIIKFYGLEENGEFHQFFASECKRYMHEFVPYSGPIERSEGGHLRGSAEIDTDTSYIDSSQGIHYDTPYAGYQYYGMRKDGTHVVKKYTTPGTGPYWDQLMLSAKKDILLQEMQDWVDKRGNK